jgi:replicative DNA helicase
MIVGAQLNRGNEKEDRRPGRTDFRDAGGLEEDAHRIIALHRPMRDFNGNMQDLDQDTFDYELLQLKLRDGPITGAKCKFHAPTTRFYEEGAL